MLKPMKTSTPKTLSRHPSQNFIMYLILTKSSLTDTLRSLDLPDMPLGYEDYLKNTMPKPPSQFDPFNRYHKESLKYIKDIGVYSLFYPDKYTKEAKSYLDDPDVKHNIEQMLLCRTPAMKPIEIAKRVNAKFDTLFTEDGIDRYRHYFWNVKIMRMDDWAIIFNNSPEKTRVMNAIRNSPGYTLAKLGFQQKIEIKEALREAAGIIYQDMQDWKHKSVSPDKTKALSTIIHDFGAIDDRLSNMDITMKETLNQFKQFRIEHTKSNVSDIHDTAEIGNYSNSGMQIQEAIIDDLDTKLLPKTSVQFTLPSHDQEE